MFLKNKISAFTLIELMVGIAVISIIIFGLNNINFNKLNDKQELEIFTNNIKTNFEKIRNNALLGKGGIDFSIPEKWSVEYSTSNSGTIINKSYNEDGTVTSENISLKSKFYISSLKCGKLGEDESEYKSLDSTGTGTLIFTGLDINLNLSGNTYCNDSHKILEITVNNKNEAKKISINSINGLVEIR